MKRKPLKLAIYKNPEGRVIKIEGQLPVIFIKEKNNIIANAPSLDLSTSGKTLKQSKSRFKEILLIFIQELIEMGTLEDVLLENGWEKIHNYSDHLTGIPPAILNATENLNVAIASC